MSRLRAGGRWPRWRPPSPLVLWRHRPGKPDRRIRAALERATDVPLEVARVATRAAILGARLVHGGNRNLKGDAVTAILLAKAAARGAVTLVEVNVRLGKLDGDWLDSSAAYLAAAGDACGVAAGDGAG